MKIMSFFLLKYGIFFFNTV